MLYYVFITVGGSTSLVKNILPFWQKEFNSANLN